MKKIAMSLMNHIYKQGFIEKGELDTYVYGMDIFLSSLIEVASIIAISLIFNNFIETVLFFMAFIPLRIFAGGYHADTRLRCYLISLVVYSVFTLVLSLLHQSTYTIIVVIGIVISIITILLFAPVIHQNKKVNNYEIRNYRKFSIVICCVQCVIYLIFTLLSKINIYLISAVLGTVAVSLSMWIALIKTKLKKCEFSLSIKFSKRW